ncbi:conserved hypothetical protein [Candidatus Zixiibacteriota bacterium]|nr:conserved hypothetical protein [candidate division Zixibacteria bacterium]
MCHVILLLPVIGLGVFFLWPFGTALPIYLAILAISGFVYFAMIKAMQRPVMTGIQTLQGKLVEVINMSGKRGQVRIGAEIWEARTKDQLSTGEMARIIGIDQLTLIIEKYSGEINAPSAKVHHHH